MAALSGLLYGPPRFTLLMAQCIRIFYKNRAHSIIFRLIKAIFPPRLCVALRGVALREK